jgi:hypothetical protein
MHTAIASKVNHSQSNVAQLLARRGADLSLSIEDGNALIRCQVSSAIAAAMLAPLDGTATGQFRALSGNLVEIDAAVTLHMAGLMLAAKAAAEARPPLH